MRLQVLTETTCSFSQTIAGMAAVSTLCATRTPSASILQPAVNVIPANRSRTGGERWQVGRIEMHDGNLAQ